jgi:membrane-associated phospholipid phosphatase
VDLQRRNSELRVCALLLACIGRVAGAQDGSGTARNADDQDRPQSVFVADAKAYVTAPLHWDQKDWLYFGGTLAAIAAAHHYDDQVRTHFTTGQYAGNLTRPSSSDGKDAIPAVAVVAATWFYASLIRDSNGRREAGDMVESAVLSSATSFVFKLGAGRQRPDETADSNRWSSGGSSFPSVHSAAAFAIGTVLAESGNDDVRWIRRVLGYGLGAATSYERLKHNVHWLSDTVAGAGLGIATAHFVMNRHGHPGYFSGFSVMPIDGGVMLTYSTTLSR